MKMIKSRSRKYTKIINDHTNEMDLNIIRETTTFIVMLTTLMSALWSRYGSLNVRNFRGKMFPCLTYAYPLNEMNETNHLW